ncbi:aminotransferase [Ostreibacterium oceani]|uniref:Aminotransferase class III-fold pyridoxal phosphate-dependent enzyme n=1 Tax=Ostreibacterium oceani TaxID=2654998 RepID=A0A6N7EU96_9GAMM|nr:aminotransferase [Ostreibacterium oceani]MPV86002.1 aminotransferase class III-fold pyridoxal phosphate-dependent enzyme [Ostreibacterium oceani]
MTNQEKAQQLEQWDRCAFFHPSTHLADFAHGKAPERIVNSGSGVYITDSNGNKLLDAFAGLYCVNTGYGQQKIIDAICKQAQELAYYHAYVGHGTEASITLSKMIIDRAPDNMSKVYYGMSGSDANETNIKIIWYYNNVLGRPEKKKIISRWRGYHGSGLMTGSLTGLELFHNQFDLPLSQVIHTDAPYYFHRKDCNQSEAAFSAECADNLEQLILKEGADTIAAFIGEPALGTGGLVPPPKGYWQAIQAVLDKYDILLIADEVISGFGRLGAMFGSDLYGMKPDIITSAKGLTSAYAPLSASIVSDKIWQVLEDGTTKLGAFGHGWTYSAHPIGAAAGVASLELVDELNLVDNANVRGQSLLNKLKTAIGSHKNVGDIRGQGLLCAIEFVADKNSRTLFNPIGQHGPKVAAAMLARHVIGRAMPQGDIIGIAPPLIISEAEIDTVVSAITAAVSEVFGD